MSFIPLPLWQLGFPAAEIAVAQVQCSVCPEEKIHVLQEKYENRWLIKSEP